MGTLSGNTVTYGRNDARFKLAGTYNYSDGGFEINPEFQFVGSARFVDPQKLTVAWSTDGVNWLSDTTKVGKNANYKFSSKTINGSSAYVGVKAGGSAWSTQGPINTGVTTTPTGISVEKLSDACIRITVTGEHNRSFPTSKVKIERSTDNANWSSIAEINITSNTGAYSASYEDTDVEAGGKYYYQAKAYNSVKGDSDPIKYGSPVYTSPSSSVVTNVVPTRTGNIVVVTWECTLASIQSGSVKQFLVMRSDNSGSYTQVGTVDAVIGQSSYSFTDSVSSGGTYQYRIDTIGEGGQSSGGTEGGSDVETVPADPSSISVYRAEGSDNVVITVTGSSSNAESVVIDRCIDGGAWSEGIATLTYAATVTYTDTAATASDSIIYRAKYTNSTGSSGYKVSATVQIKQKPNPPTLKNPINGAVIDMAAGTVRLVWQHRPKDGSPQLAANIQYKIGSGSWTTVTATTSNYYDLSLTGMSANSVITWKVQTKGSYTDTVTPANSYSDYSAESTFTLKTKPSLAFTEPDNADVIDELPVVMEFSYSDACGTLKELKVEIIKKNTVVKTVNVDVGAGTSGTYTHNLKGFLFENNTVYGLKAYALSSSGLSDETSISITIQYAEVSIAGGLLPSVASDPETGYALITCLRDKTPGQGGVVPSPVAISEAYLYRAHDGEDTLVSSVYEGAQIADKYAPINVDYGYKLLLLTVGGAVSIVSVSVRNNSPYWFCYFGDEIAKAKWNPEGSVKLSRPQRTEVRYSGRRYPVSYDQDAIEETFDFTTVFTEREGLNQFRRLMRQGGTGIWKSGDGDVYDANFEFEYSADYRLTTPIWNASLSVTRIDGGDD